jgi:Cyclin, N-terminal domain
MEQAAFDADSSHSMLDSIDSQDASFDLVLDQIRACVASDRHTATQQIIHEHLPRVFGRFLEEHDAATKHCVHIRQQQPLEAERTSPTDHDQLVSLVQECANLITDLTVQQQQEPETADPPLKARTPSTNCVRELHRLECLVQNDDIDHDCLVDDPRALRYWRSQMLDWSFLVVDSLRLSLYRHDVVPLAMQLLDRYVAAEVVRTTRAGTRAAPISRDDYQLYSMTCLFIATKVLVPPPVQSAGATPEHYPLTLASLVEMSRHFYSLADLQATERDILRTLQWHVHKPTVTQYCRLYQSLLQSADAAALPSVMIPFPASAVCANMSPCEDQCMELAAMALRQVDFASFDPSLVALAVVLLALRTRGDASGEASLSRLVPVIWHVDSLDYDEPVLDVLQLHQAYQHLEHLYLSKR